MTPHLTSWRSVLILSSHLLLGLPSVVFPSCFPTKTLCTLILSPTFYMPRPSHSYRFGHPNNICLAVHIIKLLIMQFSSLPLHLAPFSPVYSPQHSILRQSPPMFLLQYERPRFTLIQNNRQNYRSVYLNLYIFIYQTGRQKVLHRIIASVSWRLAALHFVLIRGFTGFTNRNLNNFQLWTYCRLSCSLYFLFYLCLILTLRNIQKLWETIMVIPS